MFSAAFIITLATAAAADQCGLYLAKSSVPGVGRGVFAGNAYPSGSSVAICPTITVPGDIVHSTMLDRYAFGSDHEDYRLLNAGAGMLFNYMSNFNVENFWNVDFEQVPHPTIIGQQKAYTEFPEVDFMARKDILAGEEIFVDYGDTWLEERGISSGVQEDKFYGRSLAELAESGICLTDIALKRSRIPYAGIGGFATKAFAKGDIVTVSPVLLLPKHVLSRSDVDSLLINYVYTSEDTDVALLPIALASMFNNGGADANLEIGWYNWDSKVCGPIGEDVKSTDLEDIEKAEFASFDFCYRAIRDIAVGEELTTNYGENWIAKWLEHEKLEGDSFDSNNTVRFMVPMELPISMIPESWLGKKCFGDHCRREAIRKVKEKMNAKRKPPVKDL